MQVECEKNVEPADDEDAANFAAALAQQARFVLVEVVSTSFDSEMRDGRELLSVSRNFSSISFLMNLSSLFA